MGETFVLLHGAWHGGWCWAEVADILRGRGHRVTTPTQTGLGERAHLMSGEIDLEVFGQDLINHLTCEDLTDVVLVGHSFGGSPISIAAERVPDRIARLVYLDARVIEAGETPFSGFPEHAVTARRQAAAGGVAIPAPSAAAFGVLDPVQAAWLEPKLTPHPLRTFESPLPIQGSPGGDLPKEYVICTDPIYELLEDTRHRVRAFGWPIREIATGHDAMVSAPQALADLLETSA